jgi:hypothetical protein
VWVIARCQRHAAILLAIQPGGQHFRSPGRARARDRTGWSRCHGKPSSSVASCAALKRTTPSAG